MGRLPGMARESVAVLAAILVAFALDAWWDERREREEMLDALDAVTVEIERNLVLLDEAIAENRGQAAVGLEVLALETGDIEMLPVDEALRLSQLLNWNAVKLELGAITAFIEGGFLAHVPDLALRAELAGIPRIQPEIDEEAEGAGADQIRVIETFFPLIDVDEFLANPGDDAAFARHLLEIMVSSEDVRRAIWLRNFTLGQLYPDELRIARDQLAETLERIEGAR